MKNDSKLITGDFFDFSEKANHETAFGLPFSGISDRYQPNYAIYVCDGKIVEMGREKDLKQKYPQASLESYAGKLIMPGFVDIHAHYPQSEMLASFGESLLQWLEKFTFPTESKFSDRNYADRISKFFFNQLLKNGTTSAAVFATSSQESTEAFFEEALNYKMAVAGGQVFMDRHAPQELLVSAKDACAQTERLIKSWHSRGRIQYALTPRFAPSCSDELLRGIADLKTDHPDMLIQTHISENRDEIKWVSELYPDCHSYAAVYDHFNLLGPKTILAHGIHLSDEEWNLISSKDAVVAHCPTSNFFLGSGLFRLDYALQKGVRIGVGTDVGGGTSFSMLQTLQDAYKVSAMNGTPMNPLCGYYLSTLGGAKTLGLDQSVGNFESGKFADFIVIDLQCTELMALRCERAESISEKLFALMMLGDDRAIEATYIAGNKVWNKSTTA